MVQLTVFSLNIYPVKSARGISVVTCDVSERGFKNDRRWLICDREGSALTQRDLPKLATLEVCLDTQLTLRVCSSQLTLPLVMNKTETVEVEVWGDVCEAWSMGSQAHDWLSSILGVDARLVFMPDEVYRPVDHGLYSVANSFADAYPFLITSKASLHCLNKRLDFPVEMDRFRPNIVIDNCEAFEEDSWQILRIGDVDFELVKPCARCLVPSIDQTTGKRTKGILEELANFRSWDGNIWFGKNALVRSDGKVNVGDVVQVLG